MGRKVKDFIANNGGHNDSLSPFQLPESQSPNCRGCHVNEQGKITKRLGMTRVVTDGSGAGYNIYRQQGAVGTFLVQLQNVVSIPTQTNSDTLTKTKTATATDTLTISTTGTDTASTTVSKTKTVTATDTQTTTITMTADIE